MPGKGKMKKESLPPADPSMAIETNVPSKITDHHKGMKVLFRLPNNAIAKEGIIDELSPGCSYIHIGKTWVENNGKGILAVLSGSQRRRDALK
jgi:hypothetical protein